MATIQSLKSSITELPYESALQIILDCRANRRTVKKQKIQNKTKKPSVKESSLKQLSASDLFSLIKELEEMI